MSGYTVTKILACFLLLNAASAVKYTFNDGLSPWISYNTNWHHTTASEMGSTVPPTSANGFAILNGGWKSDELFFNGIEMPEGGSITLKYYAKQKYAASSNLRVETFETSHLDGILLKDLSSTISTWSDSWQTENIQIPPMTGRFGIMIFGYNTDPSTNDEYVNAIVIESINLLPAGGEPTTMVPSTPEPTTPEPTTPEPTTPEPTTPEPTTPEPTTPEPTTPEPTTPEPTTPETTTPEPTTTEEPEVTTEEPEVTTDEPEVTTDEPEVTTDEPEVTTDEPEVTTDEPEVTTDEPEVTTDEPEVTTDEPEITTDEPEVTTEESEVTTDEPEVTTDEPEVTTDEPEVTTDEPEVTTDEPEVTTDEPEVTTDEPEVTTDEPEVTTDEPEVTTDEPEVTTDEPEVTTTQEPEYTTSYPEEYEYNFDEGLDGWTLTHMNGARWRRNNVGNSLPVGYPPNGPWALQMVASDIFTGAVLAESPMYEAVDSVLSVSLGFWINGENDFPARLKIRRKFNFDYYDSSPVVNADNFGDQQNPRWLTYSGQISVNVGDTFSLVLEGHIGANPNNSVVVDSVSVSGVRELSYDSQGFFDFENGLTGWMSGNKDGGEWRMQEWNDLPEGSSIPEPARGSKFLMVERFDIYSGDITIESPKFYVTPGTYQVLNVKFWLSGSRDYPVDLRFRVKYADGEYAETPFLSLNNYGDIHYNDWVPLSQDIYIPIDTEDDGFQLVIEADLGSDGNNALALDEILVSTHEISDK